MLPSGGPCRSSKLHECQCPFPSDSGSPETSRQRGPPPAHSLGSICVGSKGATGQQAILPEGQGPGLGLTWGPGRGRSDAQGQVRGGWELSFLDTRERSRTPPALPREHVLREHIAGNPPPWEGAKVRRHRGTRASVSRTATGHAGWDGAAGVRREQLLFQLTPEQAQASLGPEGLWLSG